MLPESVDVVVVGAGNAAHVRSARRRRAGRPVLVLERAPEEERGGNTRFTAGALRVAYDGVDDLRALMPDLTDEEIAQHRFRHLHRGPVLRRHGARDRSIAPIPI